MTIVIDKDGNRFWHTSIWIEEGLHIKAKAAGISLTKTLDAALKEKLNKPSTE